MCLYADKGNPLKGEPRLEFDKDGYVTCWKVYQLINHKLAPFYQACSGPITNGWIVSDRQNRKVLYDDLDCVERSIIRVYRGIHVCTDEKSAETLRGPDDDKESRFFVVTVRCHKSQLVAVSRDRDEAVFMKVFLKKADHDKAVKG